MYYTTLRTTKVLMVEDDESSIILGTAIHGAKAAGKIKLIDQYKKTPIVAATSFTMKGDKDEILKAG